MFFSCQLVESRVLHRGCSVSGKAYCHIYHDLRTVLEEDRAWIGCNLLSNRHNLVRVYSAVVAPILWTKNLKRRGCNSFKVTWLVGGSVEFEPRQSGFRMCSSLPLSCFMQQSRSLWGLWHFCGLWTTWQPLGWLLCRGETDRDLVLSGCCAGVQRPCALLVTQQTCPLL